jgi:uncharacterized protein
MSAWLTQTRLADPAGPQAQSVSTHAVFSLAGVTMLADPSGALFLPSEQTLIVADLHLEKGSAYARRGQPLPPYDSAATLNQLARLIERHQPNRVIALGDSVDDPQAWERLAGTDRTLLEALVARVDDWLWIAGNHDPEPPVNVPGRSAQDALLGSLVLRHEPGGQLAEGQGEIAGHLHPAARVIGQGASARRPAFATDGRRLILPAFGAYAGGLCLSASPFKALFRRADMMAYVCGRSRVFRVAGSSVLGWR